MCEILPADALFNQTCCAVDDRSYIPYGTTCTPDVVDSPCTQTPVCDGERPYCLSLVGSECNGTGVPDFPIGECNEVGECVYIEPTPGTSSALLTAVAAVSGTAAFIALVVILIQFTCKARRPKEPFGSRDNEPGPEDVATAVRAAFVKGARLALQAEIDATSEAGGRKASAEYIAKQEELLAVKADLFAAQFMGDFEPHMFADAELSPHWSKLPDGGFEFAFDNMDGARKGKKSAGENELEAAIRAAFSAGEDPKSFNTTAASGNMPYSVILLMGAEVVYPRACSTKDDASTVEIDGENNIYEVHEGPEGTEKDLIQTIDLEGEHALVQDPAYLHVMCPSKLGFEVTLMGDEEVVSTASHYVELIKGDLGATVKVLRVTTMPTTLVCYGPSACAVAAQRLFRSGTWDVAGDVVTNFRLLSPMQTLAAAARADCQEKVDPVITYDVVRVEKMQVLEDEIHRTAVAAQAAEDARQLVVVSLEGMSAREASAVRKISVGDAESALKAAFSDFTRHEVARIRAQMESSMHLDTKLRQRLAAKLEMVEKELDASDALAAAVEEGKTEDDFTGAMRQAFIDHKKAQLATGRVQSERQATTAALLRARMANKLSGIDAELRASSKPDLHLFEGMDQLQTAASQLRVAMGKEVNIGDRNAVARNQGEKVAMVEQFLNVLPEIKRYLQPLVQAQGTVGAPPPPDTVVEVRRGSILVGDGVHTPGM